MSWIEAAKHLSDQGTPFVIVTMVTTRGYAPQDPGAKAIVSEKGLEFGTVGGGRVEAKAIGFAQEMILGLGGSQEVEPKVVRWNLQRDVGMSCGGEVELFFEIHARPNWTIAVMGAGHVAQSLIRILLTLKAQVLCIDPRKEWTDKLPKDNPCLKILGIGEPSEIVAALPKGAFCVVMTKGHATDLPVLKAILTDRDPPYLGVIGSPVKAIKIKSELKELGIDPARVDRLKCPMGLKIQNKNDPAEIAISIVAELISMRASTSYP